jgi:uncharacterized protein YcbK (DUF882 family)
VSRIESTKPVMTRRMFIGGMAVGLTVASPAFASAPSILKGAGDFRALNLINSHTSERLNCVYWIDRQYVPEALEAFNYFMRDWRENKIKPIDPRTLDIMAATQCLLDCDEPFHVISGYRTARTNAMLRGRSSKVARNSYHIKAMACDLSLKSRDVFQVAAAAKSLGAGGVGKYTRSQFTHVDCGPVRQWGA